MIVVMMVVLLIFFKEDTFNAIKGFMRWVEHNIALGIILYLVTYTTAVVILIPATVFTFGGAYVFG